MKRDMQLYVQDIWDCIEKIHEYAHGLSKNDFYDNSQLQDAVVRRLEIMGEAVKHIPQRFRSKYPNIPWKEIAGIRDILIHEYFGVNLARIWNVIERDIPELRQNFLQIRGDLFNQGA